MTFTPAEEARILAIERLLNNLQVAISKLATRDELRKLLLIKQQEIANLTTRVVTLESAVQVLQDNV